MANRCDTALGDPGGTLEGVEDVSSQQSKDGHDQDRFQLFVVGRSAAEVKAHRFLRVILNGQMLAYIIGCDVLAPMIAKFTAIGLALVACLVSEPNLVVTHAPP